MPSRADVRDGRGGDGELTRVGLDHLFRELSQVRRPGSEPNLEAIWMALLVEDAFGITLTDAQIDAALLNDLRFSATW